MTKIVRISPEKVTNEMTEELSIRDADTSVLGPKDLALLYEQGKEAESKAALEALGGVEGLCKKLSSSFTKGLPSTSLAARQEKFGKNVLPSPPMESWLSLFLGAFNDEVLISEFPSIRRSCALS